MSKWVIFAVLLILALIGVETCVQAFDSGAQQDLAHVLGWLFILAAALALSFEIE